MPNLKSGVSKPTAPTVDIEIDPVLKHQIERLYRLIVYARWSAIVLLWSTVGVYSLWGLRHPIELIHEYFTWAAVKSGLYFEPIPAIGFSVCVTMTASTLVWQTRNTLWGISRQEREHLTKQVCQIRHQGRSHPLWKAVAGEANQVQRK